MSRGNRKARIAAKGAHPVPEANGNRAIVVAREDGPQSPTRPWRASRRDGWYSTISALGGETDKVTAHRFRSDRLLQPEECSALYHGDDLAAHICDSLPREALMQPVTIVCPDDDLASRKPATAGPDETLTKDAQEEVKGRIRGRMTGNEIATAMTMAFRELGVQEKVCQAAIWGRVFGGAALLLGTDDGQPHQPLNQDGITRLRFLRVLDRRSLVPVIWYSDPTKDDKFGEPMIYRIYTPTSGGVSKDNGVMVHESRLVMFGGALTAAEERVRNGGWDHSVLQRVWAVLQQTNHAWQAIQHMVGNASQAVMAIKNLQQLIEDGDGGTLEDRLEITQLYRLMKIMPIDADGESFDYKEQTFTGLDSIVDKLWQRLAASAREPLTSLFGVSPAGMNATGESDRAIRRDQVRSYQIDELKPRIERIVEVLFLSKEGPTRGVEPEEWDVDFAPLEQMSPLEISTMRQQDALTDQTRINSGVLLAQEVTASRFRPEGYAAEIQIDQEARDAQAAKGDVTVPLNGAQISSIVEIVVKVASGDMPRDAGVQLAAAATGKPVTEAEAMLGSAGTDAFVSSAVTARQQEQEAKAAAEAQQKEEAAKAEGAKAAGRAEEDKLTGELLAAREARQAQRAA